MVIIFIILARRGKIILLYSNLPSEYFWICNNASVEYYLCLYCYVSLPLSCKRLSLYNWIYTCDILLLGNTTGIVTHGL